MSAHILIVEDDPMLRAFLTTHLEAADFRVSGAGTGDDGLKLFDAEAIDLIVLDLTLPDIDGLEIAERVRRKAAVPILILTARTGEIDRLVGLGVGASGYLAKPVEPADLIARVRALLDPGQPDAAEQATIF